MTIGLVDRYRLTDHTKFRGRTGPLVLLLIALAGCGGGRSPVRTEAALVGGQPITQRELDSYVRYALSFYAWAYGTGIGSAAPTCDGKTRIAGCERVRRQALRRLLEEKVIVQYAERWRIRLSHAELGRVQRQASKLQTRDTTAAQLLAQRKINRPFIFDLLRREALVRKVEAIVTRSKASAGTALHVKEYIIPMLPGVRAAKIYRQALDLATDGKPVPPATDIRMKWMAPFRVPVWMKRALVGVAKGQFIGPYRSSGAYLVVQYLGRGVHRYGRPARLALQIRYFRDWLRTRVKQEHPECFTSGGRTTACPVPDH